jgi:hypothetical protein
MVLAEEAESAAGVVAGAIAAVSVEVVDDLEPSLHAQANPAIAAINNNFFIMFYFNGMQNYAIYS